MLTILILKIIIASLFIYGFEYTTIYSPTGVGYDEKGNITNPYGTGAISKEIFWWYRFYLGRMITKFSWLSILSKPLFTCVICMSSIYGTIIYWTLSYLLSPIVLTTIILWPISLFCVAGLNRIIKMIMSK
jgi:hypothetical protein